MERHYAGLGKPAVAAVLGESDERSFLQDLGWVPESHDADTLFQLASVASVRRALRSVDHSGVALTVDGATATAAVPGLAQGLAAYADDWVGFRGIEVDPDHRRQGLARTIMAALLAWGAELRRHHGLPAGARPQRAGAGAVRLDGLRDPPRLRVPDAALTAWFTRWLRCEGRQARASKPPPVTLSLDPGEA